MYLILDFSNFSKRKASKDGYDYYCKTCKKAVNKKYRKTPKGRKSHNASNFKVRYGITHEDRDKMLIHQNNRCKLCDLEFDFSSKKTAPHVDHCHETGKIRGLLCNDCNIALGKFNDSVEKLQRAIYYLRNNG